MKLPPPAKARLTATAKRAGGRKAPHVPGQLFGYSLQTTRAVIRLLEGQPGSFVSLEVFDDVGIEDAEGIKTAEQTKSVARRNPIADRSVEFWKTISNWLAAVEAGEIDVTRTTFELHLSRKCSGRIAESFASANSASRANEVLRDAISTLWGPPPSHAKRAKVSVTLAPYLEHVFGSDQAVVASVIERFALSFGKGDATGDIENLIATKIVSPEMRSTVANQMLGWTKSAIDQLLEDGKPAMVSVDAFNVELLAFVQKYDRRRILHSFAPAPSAVQVAAELPSRTYIRQLELIELEYEEKLRAANDFLRASLERSIWAEKGLVHPSSFNDFEEELERAWAAKKISVEVQTSGRPARDVGRLLFAECIQVKQQLEAIDVPPHFTPGCLHALAEDLTVGWHPKYREELTTLATTVKT